MKIIGVCTLIDLEVQTELSIICPIILKFIFNHVLLILWFIDFNSNLIQ